MKQARVLLVFIIVFYANSSAYSLVLCAASGEAQGTVLDGSIVRIRSNCESNETAIGPFTFLANGNLQENVEGTKISTVGSSGSLTIGSSLEQIIGEDFSSTTGANHSRTIGNNETSYIGGNSTSVIASDKGERIGSDFNLMVGRKLTIRADDDITLRSGSSTLSMKKNGDIFISGRKISLKGRGNLILTGSKIIRK